MDPHDPGISKNKPFKKGEQKFYLAVVLCRATSLSLLMYWQLLSCCVFTYSVSQNCWETLLSAVFLPSQCWWARFGELPVINNIGRTRRWAKVKKKKKNSELSGSVPAIFVWDCSYWLPQLIKPDYQHNSYPLFFIIILFYTLYVYFVILMWAGAWLFLSRM